MSAVILISLDIAFAVLVLWRPKGFEKMLVVFAAYKLFLFCNAMLHTLPSLSFVGLWGLLYLLMLVANACLYVAFCVVMVGPRRFGRASAIVATVGAAIEILWCLYDCAIVLGGVSTTASVLIGDFANICISAAIAVACWAMVVSDG